MKIKFILFASIGLLIPGMIFTGCGTSDNNTLKTTDDLVRTMKQCKEFADARHVNKDSLLRVCEFTTGDPPVVCLNDTLYIYFGQGDSASNSPLSTTRGIPLTQVRSTYYTGPNMTQESWTYIGIDSAKTLRSYGYRIAIPLNQYTRPSANGRINVIEPIGPGIGGTK